MQNAIKDVTVAAASKLQQMQTLNKLQNQVRDLREACRSKSEDENEDNHKIVEGMRAYCRELYKRSRKVGVHQASIDVKAAAGRAFEWSSAMRNIATAGRSAFMTMVTQINVDNTVAEGFAFEDLWKYQVRVTSCFFLILQS